MWDPTRVSPEFCSSRSFGAVSVCWPVVYVRVYYKLRNRWQVTPGEDGWGREGKRRLWGCISDPKTLPGRAPLLPPAATSLPSPLPWQRHALSPDHKHDLEGGSQARSRVCEARCACSVTSGSHGLSVSRSSSAQWVSQE